MAEFTTGSVLANGIKQHYYHAETPDRPVIILLHGVTDNGMCWVAVARELRDRYDVYMPDARGHGLSEAPETGYSSFDRADDLAAFIQALHLDRPVLYGHSMGADTALNTAARYPGLMRAIILEDPPLRLPEKNRERQQNEFIQNWKNEIIQRRGLTLDTLINLGRKDNPQWPDVEFKPWAESKQQVSPNVADVIGSIAQNWRESLPAAACPILLITADPQRGAIITPEISTAAAGLWKSGQTVNVANAGHCIHRDQFEPVMQAVQTFLAEVTAD